MRLVMTIVLGIALMIQLPVQAQPGQEYLQAFTNDDAFVVGENLLVKLHCLEDGSTASSFSKVAFVELVDERARPVMQKKIRLQQGSGNLVYFLPSFMETGNYSLIAYTKWMKHTGSPVFRKTIAVINPFKVYSQPDESDISAHVQALTSRETEELIIATDKEVYGARDKVMLDVGSNAAGGNYHISVRKVDGEERSWYAVDSGGVVKVNLDKGNGLADYRGNMLSGTFLVDGMPMVEETVYLTLPGLDYVMAPALTDEEGRFHFVTDEIFGEAEVVLSANIEPSREMEFKLDDQFLKDYSSLRPAPLKLDSSMRAWIEEKSVQTQVENSYYEVKREKSVSQTIGRFYGKADKIYNLDDYTRFVLMEEVIREYVGSVYLRKENEQFVFKVRNFGDQLRIFNDNPLMLIDGVPVFTTEAIMALDPLKIKKIELLARHYFYGPLDCKGIMSFETYEGNLEGYELPSHSVRASYQGLERPQSLSFPDYETKRDELQRIPDFRTQLYWSSQVTNGGKISFYTSDIAGTYEVNVKGIDPNGIPVEGIQRFEIIN